MVISTEQWSVAAGSLRLVATLHRSLSPWITYTLLPSPILLLSIVRAALFLSHSVSDGGFIRAKCTKLRKLIGISARPPLAQRFWLRCLLRLHAPGRVPKVERTRMKCRVRGPPQVSLQLLLQLNTITRHEVNHAPLKRRCEFGVLSALAIRRANRLWSRDPPTDRLDQIIDVSQFLARLSDLFESRKDVGSVFLTTKRCESLAPCVRRVT